jgi:hypothetical protein
MLSLIHWNVSDILALIGSRSLSQTEVSIPVDANLTQKVNELALVNEQSLSPVQGLSDVFPDGLLRKHLHIVMCSPSAG